MTGMLGYFNGIGEPRTTVWVTATTAVVNAVFNELFIVELGWGVAGSGWATTAAQASGLLLCVVILLWPASPASL